MIEAIHRTIGWVLTLTRSLSAIFLAASVTINFINIVGRYVFSVSLPWAEEIMLFLMVGCVFTGCCAVAWEGRHIRMDVLISALPPKLHAFFNVLSDLVLIAAGITVTMFSYPVIRELAAFDERSEAANFPLVIPQSMVPIGYSLMALLVIIRLLTPRRSPAARGTDTHS
ncbi:MAG: TRAP transporter small permease [Xanthobacteraceae bacterium]